MRSPGIATVGSSRSSTNLRGGHAYADIVRKSEKKPIRIYMQDGRNDNRGVGRDGNYDEKRDWFFQNVRLMEALRDKGYDLNYQWGIGRHSQKHGGAIFPDMMRWLWRDHPVSTDVNPVTLPDGRGRLFTRPSPTGSGTFANTTGMVAVALVSSRVT